MLHAIIGILWVVFIFNLIQLVGMITIGKFLYNSNIFFLRVLMNPAGTSKFVTNAAGKALRHGAWVLGSGALLYLICF